MSQDSKTTIQERIQASQVKTENAARKKRVASVPSVGGPSKRSMWGSTQVLCPLGGRSVSKVPVPWTAWRQGAHCRAGGKRTSDTEENPTGGDQRRWGEGSQVGTLVRQPQILTTTSLKTGEKLPRLQLVWFLPAWRLSPGKSEVRWPVSIVSIHSRMMVSRNR